LNMLHGRERLLLKNCGYVIIQSTHNTPTIHNQQSNRVGNIFEVSVKPLLLQDVDLTMPHLLLTDPCWTVPSYLHDCPHARLCTHPHPHLPTTHLPAHSLSMPMCGQQQMYKSPASTGSERHLVPPSLTEHLKVP
jgi:hypothetical protein